MCVIQQLFHEITVLYMGFPGIGKSLMSDPTPYCTMLLVKPAIGIHADYKGRPKH